MKNENLISEHLVIIKHHGMVFGVKSGYVVAPADR